MMEKSGNQIKEKKQYVSVRVEMIHLDKGDIVTASVQDPQAGNDINQDDIFG